MKTITIDEVNKLGFIEKSYRPWTKNESFMVQLFSNKWLDLFQKRGSSIVYLGTVIA